MPIPGKLTREQLGYSMPVDAPLYERLPDFYKGASMLLFRYETDPEAAQALVPAQFQLADRPVASTLFAEYPWSTLGPYNEVAQTLECTYKGQPMSFAVRLHVTTDAAMAAGREIAGFPKKIAHIEFHKGSQYLSFLDRPCGLRLCSATVKPLQVVQPSPLPMKLPFACVRLIPSPEEKAAPSLLQLVGTTWILQSGELWLGRGTCSFSGASDLDPYHKLPVRKLLECTLFLGDMEVASPGTILENL